MAWIRRSGASASRAAAALLCLALVWAGAAQARGAPRVATDIPPVHSLTAMVMEGRGAPTLIVPPGASPHAFALRPSQARALADADVVIWIGAALTPWFAEAVQGLASRASSVELARAEGVVLLPRRAVADFREGNAPGHGHDHGRPSGTEDRGDALAGADEHLWLDPRNAVVWLGVIAEALADADPEGAALYRANAARAEAGLLALEAEIGAALAPVKGRPYVVLHDAYQYFGARFDVPAAGAVSMGDAARPGAARLLAIREVVAQLDAVCAFAEPQFPSALLDTAVEGAGARLATLDPLGAALEPGPELYPALLREMARSLRDCLG